MRHLRAWLSRWAGLFHSEQSREFAVATDPLTFALLALILTIVAMAAC